MRMDGDYALGRSWAKQMYTFFRDNPHAQHLMDKMHLSMNDIKQYYLRRPYYDQVHDRFCRQVERTESCDPVKQLLIAVYKVKREQRHHA